jgi:hypothetical protein
MAMYDDNERDRTPDHHGPAGPGDPATGAPGRPVRREYDAPSERYGSSSRSGAAFISIVLVALVIAGVWWVMGTTPDPSEPETTTTGYEAAPDAGVPGVVGTPGATGTSGAGDGLIGLEAGDEVNLHDARITEVAGDRTFWIAAGAGERMLVLAPHATGVAGQVGQREGFRAGQAVTIEGRAERADATSMEGLDTADREVLQAADGLIIRAIRVTDL